jgi:hypothetical protein
MCLQIHEIHAKHANQPFAAKEDLKVWKILRHYNYWQVNKDGDLERHMGIQTPYYQNNVNFTQAGKCVLTAEYLPKGYIYANKDGSVTAGIHGYYINIENSSPLTKFTGIVVHPAVIPRGTLFFIGTDWEIVAERMIIYVDEAHCPSDAKEIDINTITF